MLVRVSEQRAWGATGTCTQNLGHIARCPLDVKSKPMGPRVPKGSGHMVPCLQGRPRLYDWYCQCVHAAARYDSLAMCGPSRPYGAPARSSPLSSSRIWAGAPRGQPPSGTLRYHMSIQY